MITRNNIDLVVEQMTQKDKNRLKNTNKEYAVLLLHCFNVGTITQLILTNDFNKYKNVSRNGNCILETNDTIFQNL